MLAGILAILLATTSSLTGCSSDKPDEGIPGLITPGTAKPEPTWEPGGKRAAIARAEQIARTYARPTEPFQQWWDDLEPLLVEDAKPGYRQVDPATIPPLPQLGQARTFCDENPYVIGVAWKTPQGTWGVDLVRDEIGQPWLALKIVLPKAHSALQSCGGDGRL